MDALPLSYVAELQALWAAKAQPNQQQQATQGQDKEKGIIARAKAAIQRHKAKTQELATGW